MYKQLYKKISLIIIIGITLSLGYIFFWPGHFSNIVCKNIGLTKVSFIDTTRFFDNKERQLNVYVRYPVSIFEHTQKIEYGPWKIKDASLDAPICPPNDLLPLIIFSHGYGCDAYINSWLPECLASHGYIVASIEHYGNTYANIILEISARVWNRVQDVSYVLDHLLEHPLFKDHIDQNRIGIAGYSQGGMTSLWSAGAIAHLTKDIHLKHMQRSPHITGDKALRIINESFTQKDFDDANKVYRDERIKAVFAITPGFDFDNWLFSNKDSLSQITVPTYIVTGEADDMVSVDEYAHFFMQHIPHCSGTVFPGKVTHWTFMNEGTDSGKNEAPGFTVDDPSVDRADIHHKVCDLAVEFFDTYLKH